jgi:signal transduction histidine kinase
VQENAPGRIRRLDSETKFIRLEDRLEFVDLLVHDLKAPISNLLAALRHLDRDHEKVDAAQRGELIGSARRSGERVMTYVVDFLTSRLLESGRLKPQFADENLHAILQEAESGARNVAADRGITIHVDCPDDLVRPTDARLLGRVLDNLLSNAVKYSATDTTIQFSALVVGQGWQLEVANDGREIPPEFQEGIFVPYNALQDTSRSVSRPAAGSTGLGLYLCKHGVRALRGELAYDFENGRNYLRCNFAAHDHAADTP